MLEPERHVGKTEARAGTTPHVARVVLVASLVLVVIAFALILFVWR
jgi:hypothetical protein